MRAAAAALGASTAAGTIAAAMLVLACGGAKPAEPLPVVHEKPHPVLPAHPGPGLGTLVRVPRPELAIPEPRPDLSEEPRWPLTIMQHPTLEPQFNVAGALADPGISWTELCARGVHHRHDPARHDELAYLGGWCAAEQHDVRLAVADLAPLMRSPVPGIANGAPLDMINVLVSSEDADHATQLLADQTLRDPHLWDLLAAAYFEIGKNDDSLSATSTALQLDPHATAAATCHRLAREILLGPESVRQLLIDQLDAMTRDPRHVDPTCAYLSAATSCTVHHECSAYYALQGLHGDDLRVVMLYDRWDPLGRWSDWINYAWQARHVIAAPGAQELMLAAIDGAVVSSECTDEALHGVIVAVDAMALPPTPQAIEQKATWLRTLVTDRAQCRTFRAQWLAAHPQ